MCSELPWNCVHVYDNFQSIGPCEFTWNGWGENGARASALCTFMRPSRAHFCSIWDDILMIFLDFFIIGLIVGAVPQKTKATQHLKTHVHFQYFKVLVHLFLQLAAPIWYPQRKFQNPSNRFWLVGPMLASCSILFRCLFLAMIWCRLHIHVSRFSGVQNHV